MFFRIKVINETKNMLPKNEPFLLVSNHQSLLDPILIIDTTKRSDVTYLMKQEVRKIPLAGTWLNNSGFYYLNRENNREGLKTIIEAINDIKKGRSVGVFIEGTRSKGPKIGEFHDASLKMALKTKAKIAVVCVDNCYNIMKRYPRKTKVLIKVCKILSYEDYQNMQTIELGNYIKQIMEDTLNEERNSGKY